MQRLLSGNKLGRLEKWKESQNLAKSGGRRVIKIGRGGLRRALLAGVGRMDLKLNAVKAGGEF